MTDTVAPVVCHCGKPIHRTADGWVHTVTGRSDCYNAARYVGFYATPSTEARS